MASMLPPEGMSEVDYEAIEAAVTETVRGRWFLNEFARRNRSLELRQVLEAMNRLEGVVAAGQTTLPPADPSIRLLMQRIKEVAGQLDALSVDMRSAAVDERFAAIVDEQARAVAGLMRGPAPTKLASPPSAAAAPMASLRANSGPASFPQQSAPARPPIPAVTDTNLAQKGPLPPPDPADGRATSADTGPDDPRLQVLSALDRLSIHEKLALFA